MNLIEIRGLNKIYLFGEEPVRALCNVNLNIPRGEFLSVMGPSGSGKSTLLTILGGLNHPTEGEVVVDGIPIYKLSLEKLADFRREYLGFIFQSFQLIPYLTVIENVMLPLAVTRMSKGRQVAIAEDILERVGLKEKQKRLPDQLSGGEQERVAIARALVNRPPILMADEPTGNLDSKTSAMVMDVFLGLNEKGRSILMITHEMYLARETKSVLEIKDGLIVP
jgi:putative ABC transport system ATP-binding protein